MNKFNKLETAKWVVDQVKKKGANEVACKLTRKRKIEVVFRDGELEKLKESTENSLNLSIYKNNKYSNHSQRFEINWFFHPYSSTYEC